MPSPVAPTSSSRSRTARLASADVARLAAVFDRAEVPGVLPPAWHWGVLTEAAPQGRIGPDGHPLRGDFMPDLTAPVRMFAGTRMQFHAPLQVDEITRLDEAVGSVTRKTGSAGELTFVEVERRFSQNAVLCVEEAQTIVFRDLQRPAAPAVVPSSLEAQWRDEICPDPVWLFRFSAATFNGHRIHYDRPYATGVEFYPGLVVHGPLIALSLLEALHARTGGATLSQFTFRAMRPLFDTAPFNVCGRIDADGVASLWAEAPDGGVAMTATAVLER
jgi:3-methylfumaryl-CoA hydratase